MVNDTQNTVAGGGGAISAATGNPFSDAIASLGAVANAGLETVSGFLGRLDALKTQIKTQKEKGNEAQPEYKAGIVNFWSIPENRTMVYTLSGLAAGLLVIWRVFK